MRPERPHPLEAGRGSAGRHLREWVVTAGRGLRNPHPYFVSAGKSTGEKVEEDFGYFDCDITSVLAAFNRRDLAQLAQFPLCDSDNRGPVRVDLAYTESGTMAALQIVEFQNHDPTPVTPVLLLEGTDAKVALAHVKAMCEE